MLSKNNRIERKDFPYILKNGKRFNSPIFLLYVAKNNESKSKFAFSVSKKVLKTAVERNKYRRRGYSVIKNKLKLIKTGYFFFFSFKKGIGKPKHSTIEEDINSLLSNSGMLI